MLRTGASRLALKTIPTSAARVAPIFRVTPTASQWNTQFSSMASKRPQISQLSQLKPIQAAVLRRALSEERKQAEAKYAKEAIKPTPETVSSTSSIHPFTGEVGGEPPHQDVDMSAGIKQDLVRSQAYHHHPASILTSLQVDDQGYFQPERRPATSVLHRTRRSTALPGYISIHRRLCLRDQSCRRRLRISHVGTDCYTPSPHPGAIASRLRRCGQYY
jgi:hypothetical protein